MQKARVFLWTDSQELRSASGVRKPVNTTSNREMPSTPTP
jgi:hypothetical protein